MKENIKQEINSWFKKNQGKIGFFNLFVMGLVVLRSAGYFHPYFPITINFIVLISVGVSVLLFNLKSNIVILLSLFFWIFAACIRVLRVDIWAERTSIYAFQTLVIGLLVFIYEYLRMDKNKV